MNRSFTGQRGCKMETVMAIQWLIYIARDGLGYGFRFSFLAQWLHCTMQNMFTLHRLGLESLLPILCRTGIGVRVHTQVRLRQCKWAIRNIILCFYPDIRQFVLQIIMSQSSITIWNLSVKIDNVEYHTHHQHHRDTKYPLHKRRHPVQAEVKLVWRLLVIPLN